MGLDSDIAQGTIALLGTLQGRTDTEYISYKLALLEELEVEDTAARWR